jgi:hypothetical protein
VVARQWVKKIRTITRLSLTVPKVMLPDKGNLAICASEVNSSLHVEGECRIFKSLFPVKIVTKWVWQAEKGKILTWRD